MGLPWAVSEKVPGVALAQGGQSPRPSGGVRGWQTGGPQAGKVGGFGPRTEVDDLGPHHLPPEHPGGR